MHHDVPNRTVTTKIWSMESHTTPGQPMGPIEGSTPDLRALHEWEGSENTWKPRGPAPLVWLRIGRDTTADIAGIPYKTIYVGVHGGGHTNSAMPWRALQHGLGTANFEHIGASQDGILGVDFRPSQKHTHDMSVRPGFRPNHEPLLKQHALAESMPKVRKTRKGMRRPCHATRRLVRC